MTFSMKCYAKFNNELAVWNAIADDPKDAIEMVRFQIGDPNARVLCSIDIERKEQKLKESA